MGIFRPNVEKLKSKNDTRGLVKIFEQEKDNHIRAEVAIALGELHSDDGAAQLSEALLHDGSSEVRKAAAEALGKMPVSHDWVMHLAHASVKDTDAEVREAAFKSLLIPGTLNMLLEGPWGQGEVGVWIIALGEIAHKGGLDILNLNKISHKLARYGLRDADPYIRRITSEALKKIGKTAVSAIAKEALNGPDITNLDYKTLHELDSSVREEAANLLAEIGGEEAIRWLSKAEFDVKANISGAAAQALKKTNYQAPSHAANALHLLVCGDPLGAIEEGRLDVNGLIGFLNDKSEEQVCRALRLLGEIQDTSVTMHIVDVFKTEQQYHVENVAKNALINIGNVGKDALISKFKEGTYSQRKLIAEVLGSLQGKDHAVVELLVNAMKTDTSRSVRSIATYSLDKLGWNPRGNAEKGYYIVARSKMGTTYDDREAYREIMSLVSLGKEAIEPLASALRLRQQRSNSDTDKTADKVAAAAAAALGEIGDERAVEPLLQLLKHIADFAERVDKKDINRGDNVELFEIKMQVVKALGKIVEHRVSSLLMDEGDMTASQLPPPESESIVICEGLMPLLGDQDVEVRASVAEALGKTRNKMAVPHLFRTLFKYHDITTRQAALEGLAKIIGAEPLKPLFDAMKKEGRVTVDSIENLTSKEAIEFLMYAVRDEWPPIRISALKALRVIGGDMAIEAHRKALEDRDESVRKHAANVLGSMRDKGSVSLISARLHDNCMSVVIAAIRALGNIGDRAVAETVLDTMFSYPLGRELFGNKEVAQDMRNLFGDYSQLILDIASWEVRDESTVGVDGHLTGPIYYHLDNSEKAVERLCNIRTPISNNILHLIEKRNDFKVVVSIQCGGGAETGELSFQSQRNLANQELGRRGDPSYDPSIYIDERAWKL
jgi:HEAT repeat protein